MRKKKHVFLTSFLDGFWSVFGMVLGALGRPQGEELGGNKRSKSAFDNNVDLGRVRGVF